MTVKPTYEELEKRVRQLEIIESGHNQGEDIIQDGEYRWLVENANELILVAQDGLIRFVNQKVFDYLGYSPEELKDRPFVQYIHTEDREIVSERHLKRLKGEDLPGVYPFRAVDRDGKVRWVEINAVRSEWNGKPATLNYINDITERKQAELELIEAKKQAEKNEIHYRLIANNTSDSIWVMDADLRFTYISPSTENLFGYSLIEWEALDWNTFVNPDYIEIIFTAFDELQSGKQRKVKPISVSIFHKDGTEMWVEFSATGLFDENEVFTGAIGITRNITERKRYETALLESQTRYQIAQRIGHVGNWEYNLNTGQFWGSDEAKRIYGFDPNQDTFSTEAIESCIFERDRVHQALIDLIEKGTKYNLEFQIFPVNSKQPKILTSIAELQKNDKGLPMKVHGVIQDITERKQAIENLRKSEAKHSKMVANIGDVIVVIDQEGINKYKSPNIEKIFGWKPEEVVGASTWDNVHPDDIEFTQQFFEKMMNEPDAVGTMECRYRCKDGSYKWIEFSGRNLFHDPDIQGLLGNYQDITERKQAEKALTQKSKLLEEAQVLANLGSWEWDIVHDTWYFSEQWQKIHGVSDNELDTSKLIEIAHPEDAPHIEKAFTDAKEQGKIYDIEHRIIRADNKEIRYIKAFGEVEYAQDTGSPVRMVGAAQDITERKQAEAEKEKLQAQLTQAQKLESVGRLAGGVAHDFNNMLGVILGHTELAMLQTDEDHDLYSDLKEIQTAAKRSANLTKQLLTFARKDIISPKQLDLNDTVESMLNMLRRLIGEDIDLVWKPSANLWPIKMDPSQIDQILANLCVNARDAIDGVGKLTIETGRKSFDEEYCKEQAGFIPGDFVLLAVSDNGCGMDKNTLDNLFEPFFTTKDIGKGTGLGLATIYGIVKQNNGFINVYSEPGQGSTFKIYLPRLVADEDIDKAVPEKKTAAGGTETILLVEDEPTILRMTRMMLERKGYSVLSAATPTEAVEKATHHSGPIDMLMTDVVMPEMNGRDLAGQITVLYPGICLLFMSGYTEDIIAHQGVLDDGVAFIQKPFSMADMTEKVREVLDMASDKNHG